MTDKTKKLPGRLLAALVILFGLGGVVWTVVVVRDSDRPHAGRERLHDWAVLAGDIQKEDATESSIVLSPLRLEREGIRLDISAGSRVRFPTEADSARALQDAEDAEVLPEVEDGDMVVETSYPVVLRGEVLRPAGVASLRVGGITIVVVRGIVHYRDVVLGKGDTIDPSHFEDDSSIVVAEESSSETEPAARIAAIPQVSFVVDAADDTPLAGVSIRVTFSHSDDGYPPLPFEGSQQTVTTDHNGAFFIPTFRPEDPLVRAHLELEHPRYLPLVHVVESPAGVNGAWMPVTIALREGETERIRFAIKNGGPVSRLAVFVTLHSRDPFVGEDAWEEGRSIRPGRETVRYSRQDGTLLVGLRPVEFRPADPILHIWDWRSRRGLESTVVDALVGREQVTRLHPWNEIELEDGEARSYQLRDRQKEPVAGTLIEIEVSGMPPVRIYTESDGTFVFAQRPGYDNGIKLTDVPRHGKLTTLSPLAWRSTIDVLLPDTSGRFELSTSLGRELRLRLVEFVDEQPQFVVSDEVFVGKNLTPVHRGADGEYAFQGPLPNGGEPWDVVTTGFLPRSVVAPQYLPSDTIVDFGEVHLDRGDTVTIRITGETITDELLSVARLVISDDEYPKLHQTYPLSGQRGVRVSGLERGRLYSYSVEGSNLRTYRGRMEVTGELVESGEDIELVVGDSRWTRTRGRVLGLSDKEIPYYRVIERYYGTSKSKIRTYHSYPLRPGGYLGSSRLVPRPSRVEVFVAGPGRRMAHAVIRKPPDNWVFDAGDLQVEDAAQGIFRFEIEGVGEVRPPPKLSLHSARSNYHEFAQVREQDWTVEVNKLLPGEYTLSWPDPQREQSREEYSFKVTEKTGVFEALIKRQPALIEEMPFRVVDDAGEVVREIFVKVVLREASSEVESHGEIPGVEPQRLMSESGRYVVALNTRSTSRLRVEAVGLVPVELSIPPLRALPDPIVLPRSALVTGSVLDSEQRRFDGILSVQWKLPQIETEILEHLDPVERVRRLPVPFSVAVNDGNLEQASFPPGVHEFRFEDMNSASMATGIFEFTPGGRGDIGVLQLRETRRIRGTVFLPDGERASHAIVALMHEDHTQRLPGRELDLEAVEYSARTDGVGRFEIDALPLDLDENLALVAHLDGWTDAIEMPLNLEVEEHDLVLDENTGLVLAPSYAFGQSPPGFVFGLRYLVSGVDDEWIDLGEVAVPERESLYYEGVTPGVYELTWDLQEPHPQFASRSVRRIVRPGEDAQLALRIDDTFLEGRAQFNGAELDVGWVLLTSTPGDMSKLRVGRVRDGKFLVPAPRLADRAYVALIPERTPVPFANFERGEALPNPVESYRNVLRSKFLEVDYYAYDLTVELPAGIAERHSDLEVEFPHFDVERRGALRSKMRSEPLQSSTLRLFLLQPGTFSLRVSSRDGPRYIQNFEIYRDLTIAL